MNKKPIAAKFFIASIFCLGFFLISAQRNQFPHPWSWPSVAEKERVIQHTAFSLVYSHKHMQSKWVAYELSLFNINGSAERSRKFLVDPSIFPSTALTSDFTKTGYDRGHLAPAGDMKFSEKAMLESFYMSNISPQLPGFNRGIWKKLEEQCRSWAPSSHPLFLVTGPILTDNLNTHIGKTCSISVPKRFFKVILDTAAPMRAIGFVLENVSSTLPLKHFALSIDEVEKITGLDFFPRLSDSQETKIEKQVSLQNWNLY